MESKPVWKYAFVTLALQRYAAISLIKGRSVAVIQRDLLKQGWPVEAIEAALHRVSLPEQA